MRTPTAFVTMMLDHNLRLFVNTIGLDSERDIAWPNIRFEPDPQRMYVGVSYLFKRTATVSCGVDGFERISGLYQLDIYDIVGKGKSDSMRVAMELVDHFRGGTVLCNECVRVHITSAWMSTPMMEENRYRIPVTVDWWCDSQKSGNPMRELFVGRK